MTRRFFPRPHHPVALFILLGCLLLAPTLAAADTHTWNTGDGNWNTASNWTSTGGGVPAAGDFVNLTGGTSNYTVTFDYNYPTGSLEYLKIESSSISRLTTLSQAGNNMRTNSLTIGETWQGKYIQSGGTNTITYSMSLGYNSAAKGYYALNGGTLNCGSNSYSSYVGLYGYGEFTQNGGTFTLASGTNLYIGYCGTNSQGYYTLSGAGSTLSDYNAYVGYQGRGSFTQNGGVHNVANTLTLAAQPQYYNGSGIYNLLGGSLTAKTVDIGSTGYFVVNPGATFKVKDDFINKSTQNMSWNTAAATLSFIAGIDHSHNFYLPGTDMGKNVLGYTNNFALGTLDIASGEQVQLFDGQGTDGLAALYLSVILGVDKTGTTVTNITGANGLNIYYDLNQAANAYLNGLEYNLTTGGKLIPMAVPLPPGALLLGSGLLGLAGWRLRRNRA